MPFEIRFARTDMPAPARSELAASVIGAVTGYAFCGVDSSLFKLRDNDEYNKTGNFWTSKASAPSPDRKAAHAATIGADKAYIFGGDGSYLMDTDEYSQSGNSWTSRADFPTPGRRNSTVFALGTDEAYMVGGVKSGPSAVLGENLEYSQSSDSWATKTIMPAPARQAGAGFPIDDIGYICGGLDGPSEAGTPIYDVDAYSKIGDSWLSKADYPSPSRCFAGGCTLPGNSKGYLMGGKRGGGSSLADCDEYYPVTDLWESKANLPSPTRMQLAAVVIGDYDAYTFAGLNSSDWQPKLDCDEFHMPRVPWVENLSPPNGTVDVPIDSNITFDLKDDAGVDQNTITVKIGPDYAIIDGVFQPGFTGTITVI